MRTNSRVANSNSLIYDERHPILLPYSGAFPKLLTQHVHLIILHGGNRLMLRVIRSIFWIPKLISSVFNMCVLSTKYRNR